MPPPAAARPTALVLLALLLAGAVLAVVPVAAADAATPHRWSWPLVPQPAVLARFVAPADPWGAGHRGVDLAGTVGQPVLAVAAGRVDFAGRVAGRGVVVVDHGRLRSTYEPVLPAVRAGQRIAAGDRVGTLTVELGHCVPLTCLHLGARLEQVYVDPLGLLGDVWVRLLPWAGLSVSPVPGTRPMSRPSGGGVPLRTLRGWAPVPWPG